MKEPRAELREKEPVHHPRIGLVLSAAVMGLLVAAVVGLPREGAALPSIARQALELALPRWKTTEPVSEIVYGTRAFDTLGETFLLLAAVVSVMMLTRHREARSGYFGEEEAGRQEQSEEDPDTSESPQEETAREAEAAEEDEPPNRRRPEFPDDERLGTPSPETARAMSVVVRTAVRMVLPVLSVAGLYLVIQGYSPGGGFPAGGVALGVALLAYAAFGYRRIKAVVKPSLLEVIELVGALAIIALLVLGLVFSGSVTANWIALGPEQTLRSGGTAQLFSLLEFFEVGAGLTIVVFSIMGMLHDWTPDEDEDDESAGERDENAGDRA